MHLDDYEIQKAIAAPDLALRSRHLEHHRHLRAARDGAGSGTRLWARLIARLRPDHTLTAYACRLPSGEMGRTAIKKVGGEWVAVCVRG